MGRRPVYRRRRRVGRRAPVRRYGRLGRGARLVRAYNPMPSFVETYTATTPIMITPGTASGIAFKVKIDDIPQVTQYANLYKQYRINWARVMLIPRLNSASADPNSAIQNALVAPPTQWWGMGRIAYAIQDSPNVTVPASEQEVLQCNGAKVKAFRTKWSCSFKPVPDVALATTAGAAAYTRSRFRQWFNFDTSTGLGNIEHGAVTAFITLPGNVPAGEEPFQQIYEVYWKVSFSLRDPQ